ncbi:MAG: soluble lytic murein transglycosylase-like protein [Cellvibrionaceae bacterium]|jgi:soluble lytic murein transglycosylase-like protein
MYLVKKYSFLIAFFAAVNLPCSTLGFADTAYPPMDEELRQSLKAATSDGFIDRFDAEVWLVTMSHKLKAFVKNPKERLHLLRKVHQEATRAQLEPELVLAVIQIESAFDPYAVSRVGAQGLMQVMPFWKEEIGRPEDNLIQLETNLRYGCTILKHYLGKEKGRLASALARYNGSYGSYKYSRKVMDAWLEHWR